MDYAKLAITIGLWVAAGYRWTVVRRTGEATTLWLAISLTMSAGLLTLNNGPMFRSLAGLGGSTAVHVTQHVLALATAATAVMFTAVATVGTARAWRWVRIAGVAAVPTIGALIWSAAIADHAAQPTIDQRLMSPEYENIPGVRLYLAVYAAALAGQFVAVGIYCGSAARHARRRALRWGMWILVAGCSAGIAYGLHRVVQATSDYGYDVLSGALVTSSIGLITVGVLIPPMTRDVQRRRQIRRLRRLFVDVAGEAPRPRGTTEYRLAASVVGIRDGLVILAPWMGGLDVSTPDAEAAAITRALRDRASGAEPVGEPPAFVGGGDLDAEATWLARVASHYPSTKETS